MGRGKRRLSKKATAAGNALYSRGGRAASGEWPSERAFVQEDPHRLEPVHDYGYGWVEDEQYFRVSWVPTSGELIAVRTRPEGDHTLLLAVCPEKAEMDKLFDGYWPLLKREESLTLLRRALAQALASPGVKAGARERLSALAG